MKRVLVALGAAALLAVSTAGGALAAPPGLEPNPGKQQAGRSNNCVGLYSAQVIHNGPVVRTQERRAEIRAQQTACNKANQK